MRELKILKLPDPILRKKASKVLKVTNREKELLSEMSKLMYFSQGVGLAATQVGLDRQLIVIDVGTGLLKVVNPVIIKKTGAEICEEGCLSVPGVCVKIKRPKTITVHFLDENGVPRELRAEGLLSRAFQHEMDHLSGVLIIDYMNPVKKLLLKSKLKRKKNQNNP